MEKDIVIIGGGPAGLSTALHLLKLAPQLASRILILEKEHYPRQKLCAGGLVQDAERILERLGLDVSEIPHTDAREIHFDIDAKGLKVKVPRRHALRVIRRDEFDAWLAEKAECRGVEIRQGITVKSITPDEDGVTVKTNLGDFHAQVVVGADGSNGITRRSILPDEPVSTARVLEVIAPSRPPPNVEHLGEVPNGRWGQGRENAAYFEFSPVPENIAGYVWDFPTQLHGIPMRCWGIYDTNILADQTRPALKDPLAQEMKRRGYELGDYEIKGHPIRWYTPWNKASVPRVLLAGDALGADPIFGEGISIALGYGLIAAHEIIDSIQRNDFSFRGYKRRIAVSPLGQALLARWLITYIIYPMKWKWFHILMWRLSQPLVLFTAWVFVLNWSKRLR